MTPRWRKYTHKRTASVHAKFVSIKSKLLKLLRTKENKWSRRRESGIIKTLKDLVGKLVAEDLAPKTIGELVSVVKKVVASAVSDDGEKLFPRDWNPEFIDLPAVIKQAQPCATKEDVERAIKNVLGEVLLEVPVRDLTGSTCLRGKDLSHAVLRGQWLDGADLRDTNLFGAARSPERTCATLA